MTIYSLVCDFSLIIGLGNCIFGDIWVPKFKSRKERDNKMFDKYEHESRKQHSLKWIYSCTVLTIIWLEEDDYGFGKARQKTLKNR